MTPTHVPIAARYAAAWGEISARVQCRFLIAMTFVSVSFGVPAYVLTAGADAARLNLLMAVAVGLALSQVSFSSWNYHNERHIALLARFCLYCELSDGRSAVTTMPSWLDNHQGWLTRASRSRNFADISMMLVTLSSNIIVMIQLLSAAPPGALVRVGWAVFFESLFALGALFSFLYIHHMRRITFTQLCLSVNHAGDLVVMDKIGDAQEYTGAR